MNPECVPNGGGTNPFGEEEEEEADGDPKIAHSHKPKLWVKLKSIMNKGNKAGGSGEKSTSTIGKGRFSFKSPFQTLSRKNSDEENLPQQAHSHSHKSSISSLRRRRHRQQQENKKELSEKAIGGESDGKMGQVAEEEEKGEGEAEVVTNGEEDGGGGGRENREDSDRRRRTQKGGDDFSGHEKSRYENTVVPIPRDKAPICRNQELKSQPPRMLSPRSRPDEKCSSSFRATSTSSNNKHLSEAATADDANESATAAAASFSSGGASLTALISECEDYIKTEEFTRELSDKILQGRDSIQYRKKLSREYSQNPAKITARENEQTSQNQ